MVTTRKHPKEFPPPAISTSQSKATSKGERSPTSAGQWAHVPSKRVMIWLLASIPFVIWDTGYVLSRPHSMPGGSWHAIWTPYALYGEVDHIYGWPAYRAHNGFTAAQASLNVIETICYVFYLWIVWTEGKAVGARGKRKTTGRSVYWYLVERKYVEGRMGAIALVIVFSASVMTLSKTTLYALNEVYSGFGNIGHNTIFTLIFLWVVPNGLWIVFPSLATFSLGREIVNALNAASGDHRSTAAGDLKPKAS